MKLFVWDFHGVLENGNDHAVQEITNMALERHGHARRMSESETHALAGRRWYEYFTYLLPDHGEEELLKLQATCYQISEKHPEIVTKHIRPNDYAMEVLEAIHQSPHDQILISNSTSRALDMFVRVVGVEKYFPSAQRFAVDTHHRNSLTKKHCLAEFLKEKGHYKSLVSIGDSPGDMALLDQGERWRGIGYLYTHPTREHRPAECHHKIRDLRVVLQEISDTLHKQS